MLLSFENNTVHVLKNELVNKEGMMVLLIVEIKVKFTQ